MASQGNRQSVQKHSAPQAAPENGPERRRAGYRRRFFAGCSVINIARCGEKLDLLSINENADFLIPIGVFCLADDSEPADSQLNM